MIVRILKPTDYTPTANDSPRCYGQLRYRRNETVVETVQEDGTKTTEKHVGKMVLHFPKGATPDLRDEVATQFIADGAAEATGEAPPVFVSRDEILKEL